MENLDYQLNKIKQLVNYQYSEALQIFDGVMLGDGSLVFNGKNAYFAMSLSDSRKYTQRETIAADKLLEFLEHIATVYKVLGIKPNNNSPKLNTYGVAELCTNISDFLTYQYSRWYQNTNRYYNDKAHSYRYIDANRVVPKDFKLTPVSLAYWFMGDGCSIWKDATGIDVSLCAYNFMLNDIKYLEDQLYNLGLNTIRYNGGNSPLRKNALISYVSIAIPQNSVDDFMHIIEPHIVSPYLYKIKYRGSCPDELAIKLKKHHNEYMQEYKTRQSEFTFRMNILGELKKLVTNYR